MKPRFIRGFSLSLCNKKNLGDGSPVTARPAATTAPATSTTPTIASATNGRPNVVAVPNPIPSTLGNPATAAAGALAMATDNETAANTNSNASQADAASFSPSSPEPNKPDCPPGEDCPVGKWERVNESMSERASAYQEQITGRSGESYVVDGVKFDGIRDGTLLDAKGPGYARFVKNGQFRNWYSGKDKLLDQAARQVEVAKGNPIQWHVAEEPAANAIRALFNSQGISGINVIFTPPSVP